MDLQFLQDFHIKPLITQDIIYSLAMKDQIKYSLLNSQIESLEPSQTSSTILLSRNGDRKLETLWLN